MKLPKLHKLEQESNLILGQRFWLADNYKGDIIALLRHNGEIYVSVQESSNRVAPFYSEVAVYELNEFKSEWGVQ